MVGGRRLYGGVRADRGDGGALWTSLRRRGKRPDRKGGATPAGATSRAGGTSPGARMRSGTGRGPATGRPAR